MTLTDQLKIIDDKIKANQAQCNVDRLAAIIFAKSSNELGKYEFLMAEDLGYKTSLTEQAKFDYSPLGKVFNKRLDKDDLKEGLSKISKNIENKGEQLLKATKGKTDINHKLNFLVTIFLRKLLLCLNKLRT